MNIIFWIILVSWVLVDTISGAMDYYGLTEFFAPGFRAVVFIFLIFYLALFKGQKPILTLVVLLVLVGMAVLQSLVFYPDVINAVRGAVKVMIPILLVTALVWAVKEGRIAGSQLSLVLAINSIALLVNVVVAYMGIGYVTYQGNSGSGFFEAGNEFAIAVVICVSVWVGLLNSNKNYLRAGFVLVVGFVSVLSVLTKSALIALALIAARFSLSMGRVALFLYVLFIASVIAVFSDQIMFRIEEIVKRTEYFARRDGWGVVLLGGDKRYTEIVRLLNIWENEPLTLILGTGWTGFAENNLFDIVEAFGVTSVLVFLWWGGLLWSFFTPLAKTSKEINRYNGIVGWAVALSIAIAFVAGHVMQSALIAIFLALAAAYRQEKSNKI